MGTLQRYILRSFLVAAGLTGLVLTFVLSVGFLFQVFQFVMRGASAGLVVQYLAASLPEVLGFTIPLALMVASLLVFGRMSTDSEVAAMKACGISFLSIMRGPLIVAILCSILGFYLQNYAMPRGHYVRRTIANRLAIDAGVQLMEPGRFIDEIDNLAVFCDRKSDMKDTDGRGYTALYNLLAIDRRDGFLREIHADTAHMRAEGSDLVFTLFDATVTPPDEGLVGTAVFDEFTYRCQDVVSRTKKYLKKPKDYDFEELCLRVREAKEQLDLARNAPKSPASSEPVVAPTQQVAATPDTSNPTQSTQANADITTQPPQEVAPVISEKAAEKWHCRLKFLLNYRLVWALSSFCFVLVGVPLGCQAQRKESSKGMVMGLAIGIAFFLFILLSEALATKPAAFPWLIVWLPVAICVGSACILIPKNQ
ncbi:MAG: LptF/LptG family permease [Kiritimatiellae bacterium]|nr:LptF/LptG family permease [Kiritimatiellia bacterium]